MTLHSTNSTNINAMALLWSSWKAMLGRWGKGDVEGGGYRLSSPITSRARGSGQHHRFNGSAKLHLFKAPYKNSPILQHSTQISSVHTKLGFIIIKNGWRSKSWLFKFYTDAFSGLRAGDVCKSGHGRVCFVLFVSKGLLVWYWVIRMYA